jgi:hypothetical protein
LKGNHKEFMARSKTVTIEGEQFTIAPLNIDQVESHLTDTPDRNDINGWRNHTLKAIAHSLNNASGETNGNAVTIEMLRQRLDLLLLDGLYKEVLQVSGLRVLTPSGEAAPKGESQAVRGLEAA